MASAGATRCRVGRWVVVGIRKGVPAVRHSREHGPERPYETRPRHAVTPRVTVACRHVTSRDRCLKSEAPRSSNPTLRTWVDRGAEYPNQSSTERTDNDHSTTTRHPRRTREETTRQPAKEVGESHLLGCSGALVAMANLRLNRSVTLGLVEGHEHGAGVLVSLTFEHGAQLPYLNRVGQS